ncbi:MAG: glycosyltransferase family 2 protein [Saprospiraceae bacterium]|nr:glycosyltransferase family 2 protein [Saprospiraceae bacterium]
MKNGIIVPCYNEAQRLPLEQFESFINNNEDYLLCFVNDGSKDNTLECLQDFSKNNPERIRVYDMPQNGGKAEAVRAGVYYLLDHTNVDTIGFLDADLSTDFADYTNLVNELSRDASKKLVFGSRESNEENQIERNGFRNIISFVIGILIRAILKLPIKDSQCGAKVFKRDAASFCFNQSFVTRWLFDVELFIRMKKAYGKKETIKLIKEVPLKRWVHVDGSKIGLKDSLVIPSQLLSIALTYNLTPNYYNTLQRAAVLGLMVLQMAGIIEDIGEI